MWISPARGFATGFFSWGSVGSLLPNIGLSLPPAQLCVFRCCGLIMFLLSVGAVIYCVVLFGVVV